MKFTKNRERERRGGVGGWKFEGGGALRRRDLKYGLTNHIAYDLIELVRTQGISSIFFRIFYDYKGLRCCFCETN